LTERIALARKIAECIERLHAVNWLHKGLRSHNILFFGDSDAEIDYSSPLISGFDYSRPAANEDMTEKPPENAAYDLYRHPRVHGSGARDTAPFGPNGNGVNGGSEWRTNFKKSYDIYSLGIILLEIAHWKPIDTILEIPDLATARPSVTIKVRHRLLNEEKFLNYVRAYLGNTVVGVVKTCLEGPGAFGIHEDKDEREEVVGAELQRGFYKEVVQRLGEMKV